MELRSKTVRVPGRDLEFEVVEGDAIIGPAIERGGWEEHESRLFDAHVRPGCRVLDLGANVGWFAVRGVLAGAEVHAFEPVPALCAIARRNVERAMAKGPGKAVVHQCAAGATSGRATIVLAAKNHGDNRVVDAGANKPADMANAESIEIEVRPVDELVKGPVRVVKIDTQGSEWLALQGAKKLLEASRELALLIEFWPYALRGCKPQELLDFLAREGFTLGKATAAPYPMSPARILAQALARDPVKGGLDLYGTRGLPFHVGSLVNRAQSVWRSLKER
jgi:FkbM family methyltransferase